MTNLTYYIFEGLLIVSDSQGNYKTIFAVSGGGSGSTNALTQKDFNAMNNPYLQGQKQTTLTRGGAIPVGRYKVEKPFLHETSGKTNSLRARLTPVHPVNFAVRTGGRDGFLIHHTGL